MADDVTFQDSALATPAAGTVVAADDVSSVYYQRVKVDLGGDGLASPLVRGQQTTANSIPVALSTAQEQMIDGLETLLDAIKTATEAIQASVAGTLAISNAGLTELAAAINASSQMDVNIAASNATVAVSNSGLTELAAAIDTELQVDVVGALPAGTNNIGDVDVLTVPSDPFGANADAASATGSISAKLRSLATNLAAVVSGSEIQADIVGALPAGANAIGKLAANSGVDIGDVTLTAGTAAVGKLLPPDIDITTHTAYAKKYYTSAGAATDGIIWSPAGGTRWHITSIAINVSAACTLTLEDDKAGGDEAIYKAEFAANSGIVMTFDPMYPWASGEDAADLIVTTTAGNVYITVVGYEI